MNIENTVVRMKFSTPSLYSDRNWTEQEIWASVRQMQLLILYFESCVVFKAATSYFELLMKQTEPYIILGCMPSQLRLRQPQLQVNLGTPHQLQTYQLLPSSFRRWPLWWRAVPLLLDRTPSQMDKNTALQWLPVSYYHPGSLKRLDAE